MAPLLPFLQDPIPERVEDRRYRTTARSALFAVLDGQDLGRGAGARYPPTLTLN